MGYVVRVFVVVCAAGALTVGCEPGVAPGPRTTGDDAGTPGKPDSDDEPAEDPSTDDPSADDPPPATCPGGGRTTVSGQVRFPTGPLPVDGALIYVPYGEPADVERSGECGECLDSASLAAHARTTPDGAFELTGVPAGPQTVVIEKGPFRRTVSVDVAECVDNSLPPDSTRLPRDSSEGIVPRIAVITGSFDHMAGVLNKLGLSSSTYDIYNSDLWDDDGPSPGPVDAPDEGAELLANPAQLSSYDIVFINCGAAFADGLFESSSFLDDASALDNVRSFVEDGGRLYVTDLAYDLAERTYPELVDFHGGGDGLSSRPEALDEAQVGDETASVEATVRDDSLQQWLEAADAISGDRIVVRGLAAGWAVVDRVDTERGKVWVEGDVSWGNDPYLPSGVTSGRGVRPLTTSFERGCGRVLFTSYHTVEGDGASTGLTAQEKALAYLVLEIGSCIEDPHLF